MRKVLVVLLLVLFSATFSEAATVTWQGLDWDYVNPPTSVSVVSGDLVVTSTLSPGWARSYTTTDYFQISADMDLGPQSVIMIDAWQSGTVGDQLALNIPFGQIGYDDDNTAVGSWVWNPLSMPTTGTHSYTFLRAADGNVTVLLDGGFLWSSVSKPFDLDISMTSVLAGAMNGTGVFTTASVVPVPPALLLLGSGLIGLVGIRRKFKR
jgi:hypothetical protein